MNIVENIAAKRNCPKCFKSRLLHLSLTASASGKGYTLHNGKTFPAHTQCNLKVNIQYKNELFKRQFVNKLMMPLT